MTIAAILENGSTSDPVRNLPVPRVSLGPDTCPAIPKSIMCSSSLLATLVVKDRNFSKLDDEIATTHAHLHNYSFYPNSYPIYYTHGCTRLLNSVPIPIQFQFVFRAVNIFNVCPVSTYFLVKIKVFSVRKSASASARYQVYMENPIS